MRSLKKFLRVFESQLRYSGNFKSITYVGGNIGKGLEIEKILGDVVNIDFFEIDLPEIQDELIENIAVEKCELAFEEVSRKKFQGTNEIVMVEDTSLGFGALNGLPGPYIRSFLDKLGVDGLFQILSGFEDKSCEASCCIALKIDKDEEPILFLGKVKGTIVEPRGNNDFGWDSIFQPQGSLLTFSEMDQELKNSISHRYEAFNLLHEYLLDSFS